MDREKSGLWVCKVATIEFSGSCWNKEISPGQITLRFQKILLMEEYSEVGFKIALLPNTVYIPM